MSRAALVALAACSSAADRPLPPLLVEAPAPSDARAIDAAAEPPDEPHVAHVHRPRGANDDLPHRTADMRARLATAQTCLPANDPAPDDGSLPDRFEFHLDSVGPDLVVCADFPTRRGGSVYGDMVSYACWNLDPKTSFLTRRRDIPHAWRDCRDGSCPAAADYATSWDGKRVVAGGETLTITERDGGSVVASFARPDEIHENDWIRGSIELVGDRLVVSDTHEHVYVYTLAGKRLAAIAAGHFSVVSDTTIVAVRDSLDADVVDLPTGKLRHIKLPGCTPRDLQFPPEDRSDPCRRAVAAVHFDNAVDHMGVRYAFDDVDRALVVVDPSTFIKRRTQPLATCR